MSKSSKISDELAAEAEAEASLSFQAGQALKQAGLDQLDAVLSEVETTEGVTSAKAVIRQTSGSIETSD